jgi:nitrite reductase (NADH) small subunit/3-phenylpropionate/trans-cinnamate dioxygenase ferredoxin subunit
MPDFVRVIAVSELAPGKGTELVVQGKSMAVFNIGGVFHAIGNTCPHRGGPLGQGYVEGVTVTCPWHAWTFDVSTGENVVNPELKVACYPTKVEDGQVYVQVE